ncbi:hypothetical protein [Spirochaeta thermophila]|nr:hypothetical protein [Spirochaeta thermophila]
MRGPSDRVAAKARELGVDLRPNTRVVEEDTATRVVTDEHGERYAYRDLVWAADLKTLYRIARTDGLPERLRKRIAARTAEVLPTRGAGI